MRGGSMAATAAVLVLSLAGCERDRASQAPPPVRPEAPAAAVQVPPSNTVAGLAVRTALNDMYEIDAGRIALQRSQDNDVKRFAQMMIDDHGRTSNEVRAMLAQQAVAVTLPNTPDAEVESRLNALRAAPAETFDQTYVDQQIQAHETALALLRSHARDGDNQVFRDWADRTAPAIENHLQMARGLKRAPSGGTAGDAAANQAGDQPRRP